MILIERQSNNSQLTDEQILLQEEKAVQQEEMVKKYKEQITEFARTIKKYNMPLNKSTHSTSVSKFDPERVIQWLQDPKKNELHLRKLSHYFYDVSSFYKQMIWYISLLPTYAYTLTPSGRPPTNARQRKKIENEYIDILEDLDKMNIAHEFINISKIMYKQDVFYGYIHESKDSFFIQEINADYCKISSTEDGVFNYAFNFSFFDGNKDMLQYYPREFQLKYEKYKRENLKNPWMEIDSKKTACFKVNEDIPDYALPPFNTVFESIFDLDDYKRIKKDKAEMDNFLLLTHKIPMDEKNPELNKFLIDLDLAMHFHDVISEALSEGVGLATTPMEMEAIRMESSKSEKDLIAEARTNVFADAGINQVLFNSDKNTSVGIAQAIKANEQISFALLRQFERWINRRIKRMDLDFKYKFTFLNQTIFNRTEVIDEYLKAAQSGIPVINELAASIGVSPLDLLNKITLEHDILGLYDKLKPLATSYTQSSKDNEGGRPTKDDGEISDSTQVTRDADSDRRKVEG